MDFIFYTVDQKTIFMHDEAQIINYFGNLLDVLVGKVNISLKAMAILSFKQAQSTYSPLRESKYHHISL